MKYMDTIILEKNVGKCWQFTYIIFRGKSMKILQVYPKFKEVLQLQGYSYKIVPEEDTIFVPCLGEESEFIDKYLDISDLSFDREDDEETIIVDGTVVWNFEVNKKREKVKVNIDVEKDNQGLWIPTPISIERDDICDRMFIPTEYWAPYVEKFSAEQRICPPAVGVCFGIFNHIYIFF